jgi:hypothetical protein
MTMCQRPRKHLHGVKVVPEYAADLAHQVQALLVLWDARQARRRAAAAMQDEADSGQRIEPPARPVGPARRAHTQREEPAP